MSQVAVETKWLYGIWWIMKMKYKHVYRGISGISPQGCEEQTSMTNLLYLSCATRGRSCSLLAIKGCWAEVTLPATHTMSIVSGLISSASLGFLALYPFFSFFLRLPYRAAERINLRSSLPFLRGTNDRKGERVHWWLDFCRINCSFWSVVLNLACQNLAWIPCRKVVSPLFLGI